jgi:hypothetical protein
MGQGHGDAVGGIGGGRAGRESEQLGHHIADLRLQRSSPADDGLLD